MFALKILVVLIPFLIAFYLGMKLIPYILLISYRKRLFDPINTRKSHTFIVSRLGGVAFVPIQCCLLIISLVVLYKFNFVDLGIVTEEIFPMFMALVCGLFILFVLGITDDLIGVNAKVKFFVELAVALLLPLSGIWINDMYGVFFILNLPIWIGVPLTVFAVVLIINAINLIDGIDGLCSGLVMVGCLVLGSLFVYYEAWIHALFAFITAGLLIPFFYYNVFGITRKKRKIFMGDTGSLTLGLSMAFLSISYAMNNGAIKPFSEGAIVVAFTVLLVPVLDVARVMWVRVRHSKGLFQADRNHIHHRLLDIGMSHQKAMLTIVGLAAFFCIFNAITVQMISNNIVLAADLFLWWTFHRVLDVVLKRKQIDVELPLPNGLEPKADVILKEGGRQKKEKTGKAAVEHLWIANNPS